MTYRGIEDGVRAMRPVTACSTEATALRDALNTFASRNGGKLPSSATWKADVREEFIRRRDELKRLDVNLRNLGPDSGIHWSEAEGQWGCRIGNGALQAFCFNSELAGKQVSDIVEPEKTVMVFETPYTENRAEPFKRRIDRTGPLVMGQLRDWIIIPVVGSMKNLVGTGDGSPASR